MEKWLFRFAIGAGMAVLEALQQYLTGADWGQLGVFSGLAGAVAVVLASVLGNLVNKWKAKSQ